MKRLVYVKVLASDFAPASGPHPLSTQHENSTLPYNDVALTKIILVTRIDCVSASWVLSET